MAKEFLDELMEALKELKEQEINQFYDKLDNGELPKLPLTPLTVMKEVNRVALRHKVTPEELAAMYTVTNPSPEERKNLKELAGQE